MITKGWYRRQRVRAALRFAAEAIHDRRGVPSRAESPHVRPRRWDERKQGHCGY